MRHFPLVRRSYNPFLAEFDFGRLIEDFFRTPFKFGSNLEMVPAVDIYEENNKIVAKVEIPGSRPEDIKLSVDGNLLTISGERKREREIKNENYYRLENAYGKFQRTVELPVDVKAEGAKATYKDGVLKVELPKAESQRSKEVKIDVN
jgi:HSP20 family protein